jgi:iron complex outermembrane receptor protein
LRELEGVLAQPVYGNSRSAGSSKYPQDAESAPAAVVVRTGGEIRAQGYRTLAEVLDSMPGIHLQYDRAYIYAGVRGVSRPGDFNSRLLVMIDGTRINDALYDGGPLGREFPLDIGLIDRVEYVPGPGSALYGSSAALGVVNVITRTPSQLPGFRSTAELGSYASRKLSATWGGELAGGRMLLGYTAEKRPGRDLYFPEFDTPGENYGIASHADGQSVGKVFAKARWARFTLTAGASQRVKDVPTASYDAVFNSPKVWTDRYAFLNATFADQRSGDDEVFARIGAERYQFRERAMSASTEGLSQTKEADNADAISGELRYSWKRWTGHRLTAGIEYQRNLRQAIRSETVAPVPDVGTDFDISSERYAFFAADEWQLTSSLLLNIGARLDRRMDKKSTKSPRLALIWTPDPAWTLKWTRGNAYREANAFERFYFDETQKVNPQLKPEVLRSQEILAIWRIFPNLSLEAAAYSSQIDDVVELMTDADGLNVFRNRGEVRSRGVDLTMTWVMAGGGQLRLSGSHQLATDGESGVRLSGAPRTLAKLAWAIPTPVPGATVNLNGQYVSSRLTRSSARLDGYARASVHLNYAPPGRPWSVSLGVYNVGGEHHMDVVGPELRQDAVRQDGRELRLQLGWAL